MPATMPDLTDTETWTDDDLDELRRAVMTEQERRWTLANAAAEAEALVVRYARATGRTDGDEWITPTGAHDAVPRGAIVVHDGQTWRNDHDGPNPWEPGAPNAGWTPVWATGDGGWTDVPPAGDDGAPAAWLPGVAYSVGDRVTHDGSTWECMLAHTSHDGWKPGPATHAVWSRVI